MDHQQSSPRCVPAASAEPVLTDAKGLVATVGTDDVVHAVNPARGEPSTLKPDAPRSHRFLRGHRVRRPPQHRQRPNHPGGGQARGVGPGHRLPVPARRQESRSAGPRRRQASAERPGRHLRVPATAKALVKQLLDGSTAIVPDLGAAGNAAPLPSDPACTPPGPSRRSTSGTAATPTTTRADFVFRVNWNVLVLNDIYTGNVWAGHRGHAPRLQLGRCHPAAGQVRRPGRAGCGQQLREHPAGPHQRKPDAHLRRRPARRPPRAHHPAAAPDNDSDPDGDVLTARLQGEPRAVGSLQSVYNGTGMQVTVAADASVAASSHYDADGDAGGVATASR